MRIGSSRATAVTASNSADANARSRITPAQIANLPVELLHHGAGKCLGEQPPHLGVIGGIKLLVRAPCQHFFFRLVFDADAMGGAQEFRILVERHDVGVARDRPEALALRIFAPRRRIAAAQVGKDVERRPIRKTVVARQIGVAIVSRCPDGQVRFPIPARS
jgi:hypothetical protein